MFFFLMNLILKVATFVVNSGDVPHVYEQLAVARAFGEWHGLLPETHISSAFLELSLSFKN